MTRQTSVAPMTSRIVSFRTRPDTRCAIADVAITSKVWGISPKAEPFAVSGAAVHSELAARPVAPRIRHRTCDRAQIPAGSSKRPPPRVGLVLLLLSTHKNLLLPQAYRLRATWLETTRSPSHSNEQHDKRSRLRQGR